MNPKTFLKLGGTILVLVGILGMVNILGPTENDSIFGPSWWFDDAENWAHLVLGIIALLAAFVLPAGMQRGLVMLLGIVGVLIGLYSLFGKTEFYGANLENPADSVLHLIVGIWALWASMKKQNVMMGA
ncbi:MAG: hypothetical protein HYW77_02085 [Parcubacteria group bacterium]|nr:hypothetical protein [Parcubacteria group bacterium]